MPSTKAAEGGIFSGVFQQGRQGTSQGQEDFEISWYLFFQHKCSQHKKSKVKHRILNTTAVTTGGEEPHIAVHRHYLLIAISVIIAAARRPPPTTQCTPPAARRPPLTATLCRCRTTRQSLIVIAAATVHCFPSLLS
jgi:hypothetical protein